MLNKKILEALNEQINKEIYSAYFYLGMSAYAASMEEKGVANWFYQQWKEELFHTKKMFDYVHEKHERVVLKAIDEPPQDFSSIAGLFEKTLKHEKKVTGLINNLMKLAKEENDEDSEKFLAWFVKEQIEEEATPAGILERINHAGEDKEALARIYKELAARG
jgi:ferritin